MAFSTLSVFGDAGWRWYNSGRLDIVRHVYGGDPLVWYFATLRCGQVSLKLSLGGLDEW